MELTVKPIPKPSFEDSPVPDLARKEKLLGDVVTYEGVKEAINGTKDSPSWFCSRTKSSLMNMLNVACGRELLMANQTAEIGQQNKAEFMCWMIEKEALLPREDRELEEFVDICNAIKILYNLNMTQSVQDKRGHNTWKKQYDATSENSSYIYDNRDVGAALAEQQAPKKRGLFRSLLGGIRRG
jgi:hypothetical protein